jgi:hypothetical protein
MKDLEAKGRVAAKNPAWGVSFPQYLRVLSVDLGGADSDNPSIVCLRFANLLSEFGDLLKSNFQLMWLTLQWFGFWEQFQQGWSNCVGSLLLKDWLTVFGFVGKLCVAEA